MSKQNDDIFSPSLSPFFINLVEDNIDDNKLERILLKFNEMLACVDSDTDVSITSNIDFEDFKDFEDFENFEKKARKQEIYNEIDEIIDHLKQTKFTSYVIVDFINRKFQRCGETGKLRQIRNLLGIWQIDRDAVKEVDGVLSKLGVCDSHFQFDNKYLHKDKY